MNNYRKIGWYLSAVAMFVLTLSSVSCTDDHFDISSAAEGKQTIWQNIQSRPDLSQYADILQSVYYSQSESKTTSETYAQLFDGDQTFTVWAPVNDSFDYAYYKRLLATGVRDSIYKVETQLIRNNMTRYSRSAIGNGSVKVNLLNSKSAWLNFDEGTFQGIAMTEPNVRVSNGALHILAHPTKYLPNLYEYMGTREDLSGISMTSSRNSKRRNSMSMHPHKVQQSMVKSRGLIPSQALPMTIQTITSVPIWSAKTQTM